MSSSLRTLGESLALPRFTFLFGPTEQCKSLASEIAVLDKMILIQDLEEPLRMATHAILFGGYDPDRDLTQPAELCSPFPHSNLDIAGWHFQLRQFLQQQTKPNILGEIALHRYVEENIEAFFERVLYRDARSPTDLEPFVRRYSDRDVCAVNIGPLTRTVSTPCRMIWLPVPEVEKQLALLRHELQPELSQARG